MAKRSAPHRQAPAALPQQEVKALTLLIKHQDYAAAERKAKGLLKRYPKASQAHLLMAQLLLKLTRYRDAEVAYREAMRLDPNSLDAWLGLAQSLSLQRQHTEALRLAEQALKHAPKLAAGWVALGNIQKEAHELEAAVISYTKALELSPGDWKIYRALAHLVAFQRHSPVFELLKKYLEDEQSSPRERADMHFVLGKAYLDIQEDEQAFFHYQEANRLMDESLPPIRAELEKRLTFTRRRFTRGLYEEAAQEEGAACPQIIVAGMSRSGKSLVESLFRGVKGVTLAGEALVLGEYTRERLEVFEGKLDRYLAHLTPQRLRDDAEGYRERLSGGDQIKVTTVPGDLWNLGLVGLWAPQVPIIFCVRNLLDLGITGYFHQYQVPEGFRYSYNLEQLGRQIACSEKIMDHWARVLPNPVYLVDYEALTADPEQVMGNLLGQLGLEREVSYAEVVGKNAAMVEALSPVESSDAPMPVVSRFNGFAERFRDRLQPLIKGYQTIADAFPRLAHPAVFDQPLPEVLQSTVPVAEQGEQEASFDWQLKGSVTVLDNGAYLLRQAKLETLLNTGALGVVAFDPLSETTLPAALHGHPNLQHFPHALLGSGQPATLYACMEASYSSTLAPLGEAALPSDLSRAMRVITRLPINTVALDAIEGLASLDWLILDTRHDSIGVLEHGKQALADTLLIHAQVSFQPRYQHQPNLAELQHWAARHGFRFYRLVEFHYDSAMPSRDDMVMQPEATELRQASALLIPAPERLAALSDAQRHKLGFLLDTFYDIHDLTYQLLADSDTSLAERYLAARGYFDHGKLEPPAEEFAAASAGLASGQPARYLADWRRRYPKSAGVRCLRAQAALLQGQDELAYRQLDRAIELAPDRLDVRLAGVALLLDTGMWWEAWRNAERLLAAMPEHAGVARMHARALIELPGAPLEALQAAVNRLEVLVEEPDAESLTLLARLAALQGEADTALIRHDAAASLLPSDRPSQAAWQWLQHGHSLYAAGRLTDACQRYWQAIQVVPQTPLTPRAAQYLTLTLAQAPEHAEIAELHRRLRELKQTHKSSVKPGRFGLPRQGLRQVWWPGNRESEARLAAYGVLERLTDNASVLDVNAEQGGLLMAMAPHIVAGVGLQEGDCDAALAEEIASYLGYKHLSFRQEPLAGFQSLRRFDLILACGAHGALEMTPEELGEKFHSLCADNGLVLLESRGTADPHAVEPGFEGWADAIARAGFITEYAGHHCDDGVNQREYRLLRRS
ncbi:sulfotransferase [Halomonas salifodinae]|uniref:sulfotransferase n=1 Tax=Halomonas salifodinae TaxID=438745 RepID=UPI0033AF9FA0